MKRAFIYTLMLTAFLFTACNTAYHKGNVAYRNMAYHKATVNYEKYLKHNHKAKAVSRLAESYRLMHDYQQAEAWYGKLVAAPEAKPGDRLHYATALKINGKYGEAKTWFQKYLQDVPGDIFARAALASCDSIEQYSRFSYMYSVEPVDINLGAGDFGITPYKDGFVFCSETKAGRNNKINEWDGHPYLELLYTTLSPDGKMSPPKPLSNSLNTPYHDGPAVFNGAGNRMYFTRSNYMNNKLHANALRVNHLQLYSALRSGNDWIEMTELPFNSDEYSTGHPAISADGHTLYFISDKPGGEGKTDIYESHFTAGQWTSPKSLGNQLNTPGYEMFPYYYEDDAGATYLFFSSDGLPGMGGLDLYYTKQQPDGSWGVPEHMYAPFNSSKDDFGILFANSDRTGFFSSSRESSGDIDKIYKFTKMLPEFAVEGTVYNKASNEPIANASVEITNASSKKSLPAYTDKEGRFFAIIDSNSNYEFKAGKEKFLPGSATASTKGKTRSETLKVHIELTPVVEVHSFGNIYYDYDKYNIRPDAAAELEEIAKTLAEHPNMMIVLSAHADSRGSDAYNIRLSEKRARAVIDYLAARGINRERLNPEWYGEAKPVNNCTDEKICLPEDYQKNRRTEFKIIIVNQ